jgi:hypothetical protein
LTPAGLVRDTRISGALRNVFVRLTAYALGGRQKTEVATMKIIVIGGTGLIGSKLVPRLREQGHEAVAASPKSGVDTLTARDWPKR